jgi:DNA mismatch repair protein PMS2
LLDAPSGAAVQLPKLRAILASRACHSAVVIGDALKHAKMVSIVRTLSTLDQPWNCPHGRPTIRHVADLTQLGGRASSE